MNINRKRFLLKINKKNSLSIIAITILSIYAYSQLGWGNLMPAGLWQATLLCGIICFVMNNVVYKSKIKMDIAVLLSVLMLAISLCWYNQDIAEYGFLVEIYNIIIFVFFWIAKDNGKWHRTFLRCLLFIGMFYTVWTYICVLMPNVYNSFVYPLMRPIGYISDIKAGFTANYGTNGLYMCIGICAFFSSCFLSGKKAKFWYYAIAMFLVIGMLLCGKRGQFLALVFAVILGYYFYNSNKKTTRMFKIFVAVFVVVVILYFMSYLIPQVATIVERFQEESQKGDVSTGRFYMWINAWKLFLDQPLMGRGWRWFRRSVYTLVDYDVHNVFLQLLVEVGLIGSIPYFVFIIYNLYKVIHLMIGCRMSKNIQSNPEIQYIGLSLIYQIFFILMCFTGTAYYQFEYLFTYMACCAISLYYAQKWKNYIK